MEQKWRTQEIKLALLHAKPINIRQHRSLPVNYEKGVDYVNPTGAGSDV